MQLTNPLYKNIGIHVIASIFTIDKGVVKVLLVKRTNEPFKGMWSLVGGALYNNEKLEYAVKREIFEKSGLTDVNVYFSGVFDAPCLQGRCSSQLSYTPVVFRSARSCQKSFRFVRSTFKPFSLFFP